MSVCVDKPTLFDIETKKVLCALCNKYVTYKSGAFTKHVKCKHNLTPQEYYVLYVTNNKCNCGCEQYTNWNYHKGKFNNFLSGHNFKGKTKENDLSVLIRSQKMIQNENWKNSIWSKGNIPWNSGLTKETNESIKKMGENRSLRLIGQTKFTSDSVLKMAETKKQLFASGKIVSHFKTMSVKQRHEMTEKKIKNGFNPISSGFKHGQHYSNKLNSSIYYASSYELKRMQMFDNDNSIISWARCNDAITYIDDLNKTRIYNPDFIIEYTNNTQIVEEVKGWELKINPKRVKLKAQSAIEFYNLQNIQYRITTFINDVFCEITNEVIK